MQTINKFLNYLNEQIHEGTRLKCDVCGRELTVDIQGKGPLICCGKKMRIIK